MVCDWGRSDGGSCCSSNCTPPKEKHPLSHTACRVLTLNKEGKNCLSICASVHVYTCTSLSVCVVYVHVHVYVCISLSVCTVYVHVHVYVCISLSVCMCVPVHIIHGYPHGFRDVCLHVCICVHGAACMYPCVYLNICTYFCVCTDSVSEIDHP